MVRMPRVAALNPIRTRRRAAPPPPDAPQANPINPTGAGTDPGLWRGSVFVLNATSAKLTPASGCAVNVNPNPLTAASTYHTSMTQACAA